MVDPSVIEMLRNTSNLAECEAECMSMYRADLVDIAHQIYAPVRSYDKKDEIATMIGHCLGKL